MATLAELKNAVREYCARYHIQEFEISEPYDLHASWQSTSFPFAEKAGCYAFFDEGGTLLYVGKASCGSTIGRRADTYFQWDGKINKLARTGSESWTKVPAILHTVPVHEAHQAPSLEEYIIEQLDPPANRNGRRSIQPAV
ncbi:GIY-YIG nuclease family protein [Altererythrobacter sp. SALINAS58]|uniref:GIY-YIG nuclease family protein n=1 Tax=Alteripontixanthobacter muriae TaxID=2705546 RepID=UPI0015759204|nr:GIY-YIG nuclease family protein [Alteripontixanthobacter muriae]NTZ42952.1 GIY-YIG nuclease family protein [Alteripontixanthobacter muriae]